MSSRKGCQNWTGFRNEFVCVRKLAAILKTISYDNTRIKNRLVFNVSFLRR